MSGSPNDRREGGEKIPPEFADDLFMYLWLQAGRRIRHWKPFFGIALVWALVVFALPSRAPSSEEQAAGGGSSLAVGTGITGVGSAAAGATSGTGATDGVQAVAGGPGAATAAGAQASTGTGGPAAAVGQAANQVAGAATTVAGPWPWEQTGKTRGGFDCAKDVRQIPWSAYAAPCRPSWQGDNGGATYRGVTKDTILIADRDFPSTQAETDEQRQRRETIEQIRQTFIDYFNKTFELYGRKVVFQEYEANPQANSTQELQDQNKEGACIDAERAVSEIKAFATDSSSGVYGECGAERKMITFVSGNYYSEQWYRKYHPFVWHVWPDCDRVFLAQADYVGKRLLNRKAKWAGDPAFQAQNRTFGIYVPENDQYHPCTDRFEARFKDKYGGTIKSRYNYAFDVSRWPDEAVRGILQFKADNVSSLLMNCDPLSIIFLTQAATQQNYRPEWILSGVAGQDTDGLARLYDQSQWDHAFGMSELGPTHLIYGPKSEPGITYKRITGKEIPLDDTNADYFTLLRIFTFLQAAGPILTPENIDRGVHVLPPMGAPDFAIGYQSYFFGSDDTPGAFDHTGQDDNREVYWDSQGTGGDGRKGTYIPTYNGKRFRNTEWPAEEPPVWPNRT